MSLRSWVLAALLPFVTVVGGCREEPGIRPFRPLSADRWIGNAVCYGPHRDGQRPGGAAPSAEQLQEDLQLMLPHWNLLRVYGADPIAEMLLEVIRAGGLEMKVMLGIWIAPDSAAANEAQVSEGIRLANEFPDIVIAVAVGNETQVEWSGHRSSLDDLIRFVREVRAGVGVPVTVADDFNFWNKPESRRLDRELDFLTVHAHPMWNGLQLENALPWVKEQLAAVQEIHPDRLLVLGETGWATQVHDEGEQARLIKGRPGQAEQKIYYQAVRAWADSSRQTVFFFEAFDEKWKGGDDPAEVEKHWGLFRTDRLAKSAVAPKN